MPPQLPSIRQCLTQTLRQSVRSTSDRQLLPLIAPITQLRSASIIASLSDNPGAYNKRIRRGRGPASGKGKTSGRGHKGQKQHGKVPAGFNGGQTPDIVVSGERGFTNNFSVEMSPLNLDRIQEWINQGRLDPSKPITLKELCSSRCLHGIKDGVKLLARNNTSFKTPINIVVSRASAQAIAAVEAAGGTVLTRYYTPFSIQKIRAGLSDPITSLMSAPQSTLLPFRTMSTLSSSSSPTTETSSTSTAAAESLAAQTQSSSEYPPEPSTATNTEEVVASTPALRSEKAYQFRLPDPISRKDIEYYRDPAHRGYLAWQLKEGEGPSLFFKTPGMKRVVDPSAKKGKSKKKGNASTNRLW